jgi:hypothetical protein
LRYGWIISEERKQLPSRAGDDRITTDHDEPWSARKIRRRTLWHVRDHT